MSLLPFYICPALHKIFFDSASSNPSPQFQIKMSFDLVGGETRSIIEGSSVETSLPDETNQIDIVFGTYSTASSSRYISSKMIVLSYLGKEPP